MAQEGSGKVGKHLKFLIDECLSHHLVGRLAQRGYPDEIHPIHIGMRSARDDELLALAMRQDRIVVTSNAEDFRKLLAKAPIHAGAILVAFADGETSWRLIETALAFIELQLVPADYMVNRVIEVSAQDGIRPYELPPLEAT